MRKLEIAANKKITGEIYGNLYGIAQDYEALGPMNNFDISISNFDELRKRRIKYLNRWNDGFPQAKAASNKLDQYLVQHGLAIVAPFGEETVIQVANPKDPKNKDYNKQHAAKLLKSIASRFPKSNPAFDFDEVEIIRDDKKHTEGYVAERKLDMIDTEGLPLEWLEAEKAAITRLIDVDGAPNVPALKARLATTEADLFKYSKYAESSAQAANQLNSEVEVRPLLVFKKKGKTVGAVDLHSEMTAIHFNPDASWKRKNERGILCDGVAIIGRWENEVGFRQNIKECEGNNLTYAQRCRSAFSEDFSIQDIPNPDVIDGDAKARPTRPTAR